MAKKTQNKFVMNLDEMTVTILGKVYDPKTKPQKIRDYMELDRFKSKLIDAIAGMYGSEYTDAERLAVMDAIDTWLDGGNWNKPKAEPKTPLQRAQDTVDNIQVQVAEFTALAKTSGMDKKMLATMIEKMYMPQLNVAKATLTALQAV